MLPWIIFLSAAATLVTRFPCCRYISTRLRARRIFSCLRGRHPRNIQRFLLRCHLWMICWVNLMFSIKSRLTRLHQMQRICCVQPSISTRTSVRFCWIPTCFMFCQLMQLMEEWRATRVRTVLDLICSVNLTRREGTKLLNRSRFSSSISWK